MDKRRAVRAKREAKTIPSEQTKRLPVHPFQPDASLSSRRLRSTELVGGDSSSVVLDHSINDLSRGSGR
jgi:hypothetical protein